MKINILYETKEGPWGGGNQFLKALKSQFKEMGVYADSIYDADVILYNSHHYFKEVLKAKLRWPKKVFIHRLDGLMGLIPEKSKNLDPKIFRFNDLLADATIFQSNWSRRKSIELGYIDDIPNKVIINAPDSKIFNRDGKKNSFQDEVKLIASSWSPYSTKGFRYYKWLDRNLDFDKYQMTFVGNSPVNFRRIKYVPPKASRQLARILKEHDICVIASENDACSNALIEALHSGLPVVALNSGGHPEIIGAAGELFNNEKNLMVAIEKVTENYSSYKKCIKLPDITEVAQDYYGFASEVYKMKLNGELRNKFVTYKDYVKFIVSELADSEVGKKSKLRLIFEILTFR